MGTPALSCCPGHSPLMGLEAASPTGVEHAEASAHVSSGPALPPRGSLGAGGFLEVSLVGSQTANSKLVSCNSW